MKRKQPTIEDVKTYQAELISKFGSSECVAYPNSSMTIYSIARYCGGCNIQGKFFIYNPVDDSLIRDDVAKYINKLKKERVSE